MIYCVLGPDVEVGLLSHDPESEINIPLVIDVVGEGDEWMFLSFPIATYVNMAR